MLKVPKDVLWKGIIEDLFAEFLYYFFPVFAENKVDFNKEFVFLDKELAEILPDTAEGHRYADKLVKVFTKDGKIKWCLIHVEVQGYKDDNFAKRMYMYHKRIEERYGAEDILAMALYTDNNKDYHPKSYFKAFEGTELSYKFNTFKVLEKTEAELDIPNNPFSIIMLTAQKALLKKMLDKNKQIEWKFALVRKFLEAKYATTKIRRILDFIRFYVSFEETSTETKYLDKLSTIIQQRKSMGLEEAILEELKRQVTESVTKDVTAQVTQQVTQEVTQQVTQQVAQQKNIEIVKKLLKRGFQDADICEIANVDEAFILKVKKMK